MGHLGDTLTVSKLCEMFLRLGGGYRDDLSACENVHYLTRLCVLNRQFDVVCRPLCVYLIHGASATRADPMQAQRYNVQMLLNLKRLAKSFQNQSAEAYWPNCGVVA